MRRQLRPFYDPIELMAVYSRRYDHSQWPDHILRVAHTADLLRKMQPTSVADLSCGDAAIVDQAGCRPIALLGDYTPGWQFYGGIEHTVTLIPPVDVFVCSETLEHVEDPDSLLAAIRTKADRLLLSTPIGEDNDDNPEHYWGWDVDDVDSMLAAAGWTDRQVESYEPCPDPWYTFQIWTCS
jgi:hypothetical protein